MRPMTVQPADEAPAGGVEESDGQRIGIHFASWGSLEITSPSPAHEDYKKRFARVIEACSDERNIELSGGGSTTFRKRTKARGLEPDECCFLGPSIDDVCPDIAFEVSLGSGGIDRLEVYRGVGAREIWFRKDGRRRVFRFVAGAYQERERSELLPDPDLAVLSSLIASPLSQTQAARAFRDHLRAERR